MSRDLRTQLAEYGRQVRSDLPVLNSDEVMFRGESPVVVGGQSARATRRLSSGLVLAAVFLVVILIGLFQLLASTPSEIADTDPIAPPSELGVFEPVRGWIVYPVLGSLEAVNPDNPSERRMLDVPWDEAGAVPVGWSADGSILALDNEEAGHWAVMDRFGDLPLHGPTGGCCLFVGSNWLSPDGASRVRLVSGGSYLAIDDYSTDGKPRFLDLTEVDGATGFRDATWSPDGAEIALVAEKGEGMEVVVLEVGTGAVREIADSAFTYIRHVAWSPHGTQLLVTAYDHTPDELENPPDNPLQFPIPSRLYLVNVTGSGRLEIASGHYVATAWSPDGTQIAALDFSPKGRTIVVMDSNGSGQTVLPDIVPDGPFTGIAWHPTP